MPKKSCSVILVPGFLDNTARMQGMRRYLQQSGIDAVIFAPQPSDGSLRIEEMAWQLAKSVEAKFPVEQSLALVGFSMGGLICRSYVQQLGGILRVRQLITLSTPHCGTVSSHLFQRPATLQMRPGSSFLKALNADFSTLQQIAFTSIWTPLDLTIFPAESSRLPVGKMMQIPTLIHRFVVDDRRVWQAVEKIVTGGE